MNVDYATAMRTRRQEQRTAVAQWRKARPGQIVDLPPYQRPSFVGALFGGFGAWIADHFPLLYLIALATAYIAGCLTGRLL